MKYDVFISYSRKDRSVVDRFCSVLDAAGITYWIDREGIGADDFKCVIVEAIEESLLFVYFASANSNQSKWTAKEIGTAVEMDKVIIPLKLDDSSFNKEVKFDLVNINFYDLYTPKNKSEVLSSLFSAIDAKLPHRVNWHSETCKKKLDELGVVIPTKKKGLRYLFLSSLLMICLILLFLFYFHIQQKKEIDPIDSALLAQQSEVNLLYDSLYVFQTELTQAINNQDNDGIERSVLGISAMSSKAMLSLSSVSDDSIHSTLNMRQIEFNLYVDSIISVLNERREEMRKIERYRTVDFYEKQLERLDSIKRFSI